MLRHDKFGLTALSVILLTGNVSAAERTFQFAWDTVPGAARYCLHRGIESRTYTHELCTQGAPTSLGWTFEAAASTHYFAVSAVAANGVHSGFSNEVLSRDPVDTDPDGEDSIGDGSGNDDGPCREDCAPSPGPPPGDDSEAGAARVVSLLMLLLSILNDD